MAADGKYLFVVMLDVEPDKEEEFNELYNNEHIPFLLEVPGVLSAARYENVEGDEGVPKYLAIYEIESPDVPNSEAFRNAGNSGDWPHKVRPHTKNRSLIVYKRMQTAG
jgi:hypothetical protein